MSDCQDAIEGNLNGPSDTNQSEYAPYTIPLNMDWFKSSVIASCPYPSALPKVDENAIHCNYSSVKIKCGSRFFDSAIDVISKFEIVCGDERLPAIVDISVIGLKGPSGDCKHKNRVIDAEDSIERSDHYAKLKIIAPFKERGEILNIFKIVLWPALADPSKQRVLVNSCKKKLDVQIWAYPKIKSKFSLKGKANGDGGLKFTVFGKSDDDTEQGNSFDNIFMNLLQYFEASLSMEYDGINIVEWSLAGEGKSKLLELPSWQQLEGLYRGVTQMSSMINKVLSKGSGSLSIYTCPSLAYSSERVEVDNAILVDYNANLEVGFDPLVELTGEYDILGPILSTIPGVGPALIAIKWLLEKCNAGEMSLKLSVAGSISFIGSIGRKNCIWDGNVDPSGKIDFKVEFVAKFDITVEYGIGGVQENTSTLIRNAKIGSSMYGGAKGGARGGFRATPTKNLSKKYKVEEGSKVFIYMDVSFTGVEIYYLKGTKNGLLIKTPAVTPTVVKVQLKTMASDDEMTKNEAMEIGENNKYILLMKDYVSSLSGYVRLY